MGVDGFRVDAVPFMFEDEKLRDEPPLPGKAGTVWGELDHIYTQNLEGTFQLMRHWADLVHEYVVADGKHRYPTFLYFYYKNSCYPRIAKKIAHRSVKASYINGILVYPGKSVVTSREKDTKQSAGVKPKPSLNHDWIERSAMHL